MEKTLNFHGFSFLGQLRQERVIYLNRKPYNVPFESNTENGGIFFMKGYRRVLVKVVLFQLRGPGHLQNDTTPKFFPDSNSPMLGLSNEVSFVSELYQEYGQNNKSVFTKTCCKLSMSTTVYVLIPLFFIFAVFSLISALLLMISILFFETSLASSVIFALKLEVETFFS